MKSNTLLQFSLVLISMFMSSFSQTKPTKILFFGDSITEMGVQAGGYIDRIKQLAAKENQTSTFDFVGKGIGGNKVYDLYLRLEEDVINQSPDVVFIYIGINDIWHKRGSGTGTDADKFEKFYQALIVKMKEKGIRIILCTPAVIGEHTDNTNEQDGELNQYSNSIRNLAKKNNLQVVDLRTIFLNYLKEKNVANAEKGILTTDRVHLNEAGNALVAQEMWKVIRSL